jgi:hypothetical protein
VADHVFAHEHRRELLAVVNLEGEADELRHDGGAARPGLDRFATAAARGLFGLGEQITVNERAFPNGTRHIFLSSFSSNDDGG